jgi:hypothetical protein
MATFADVTARVGLVAAFLLRTLVVVVAMLGAAALALFLGVAVADDWSGTGLLLGAVLGGGIAALAVVVLRFALDVRRIRDLPQVSRDEVRAAAGQLATTARDGERQFMEARGLRRLVRLAQGLWDLKADVDALGDGGLAPAVSLGRALRPIRLGIVALSAVASPFLLAFGLFVLVVAATVG